MGVFDSVLSTVEGIGISSPVSNDEGVLTNTPKMKYANPESNIKVSQEHIDMLKNRVEESKKHMSLFENTGAKGLSKEKRIVDVDGDFARGRAKKIFNEVIELLSEDQIEYWAGSSKVVKEAALKFRPIFKRFLDSL
jgi:hypothetical protein